jgi:hypothetical protein
LDSSLWALRSSLSFNSPTIHSLLSAFVFIKFCLTTGRSDQIVYEKLVALVASSSLLQCMCWSVCVNTWFRKNNAFSYIQLHALASEFNWK